MIGSTIQTLRSKVYSGGYDLIAVRKLVWQSKSSRNDHFQQLQIIPPNEYSEFGILNPEQPCPFELEPIALRMLEISQYRMTHRFNKKRWDDFIYPSFFENKLIFGASEDDLSMLCSAEYVAMIFNKLNIFKDNEKSRNVVPLFKPKHFSSGCAYAIPFNEELIRDFQLEMYIYLDYQVFPEDIVLRTKPEFNFSFPKAPKSLCYSYYSSPNSLQSLSLKTGDVILFQEEGPVANMIRKVSKNGYTRVAMVVSFPGIRKLFLVDAPPMMYVSTLEQSHP